MGKNNVNKRFTVSLDIDTKDVEKQVKATVGNLKTILADLGKASDKMGYFKELVNYIGQVDTALTTLKNKNKNAFDHMFDGLDEGLKRQLQELFGTSGEQLGRLDVLREKLATLTPKSSIKELRNFAKEINDLFADIGAKSPFEDIDNQFSGRTNADHIKLLTDALDNFATVWNGVNEKIKGGFGLGGAGGQSGSITGGLSEEVQAEIDKLNKQIQELEVVREKFKELSGRITSVKKGKAISDTYKIDLTAESIQKLMDEFDALKAQMDSSDKSSIDYYNNLLKISEVSLTLKKALSDVRADNSIMQTLQGTPSGGALGSMYSKLYNYGMVQADNILDKAFNVDKNKDIITLLDTILNKIEAIKATARNTSQTDSGNVIDIEAIKKQINELENQASRLKEIALLFEDIKYEKIAFDDDGTLSEGFAVEKTVESIQQLITDYRTAAKAKAEFEAAGDTSSADYYNNLVNMSKAVLQLQEVYENMDDSLEQSLSEKKIGRGNLLDSLEKVAGETEGFFDDIFVSVSDTINKLIDESTVKLQTLRENLKKIESQPKTGGTTEKSGSGSEGGNGSGGSGNGQPITDIDFTSLENTIKSEISSLANKLDNVFKVEVVKNDTTDIQNAINGIKSTIEQISASIDKYKASKAADQNQAAVDAMKNNLTQLYKYVSDVNSRKIGRKYQDQEIGAAILSDGSISTAYGEDGTVPWDRLASSLVANLTKSLLVDVHSHPWSQFQNGRQRANDFFSGSNGDLGAFRRSKELGAQISAMITGNIMRTLDLSKLTGAQMNQFRTALADIEKTYANTPEYSKYMVYEDNELKYRGQSTLAEQHKVTEAFESLMYKAFERIGYSKDKVDQELFKKYNLTDDKQLTELAERLVQLSQSSQNALSPVERLAEIISGFGGDIYSEKAKVGFEAFQKGELSAAAVFNGLNDKGYKISQNTLDSLYTIDSTNEISAVESLLTQITSVLDVISSSVSNIDGNTRKSTSEKFDTTINDIVDISNGKISEHITQGIKSIFDPLNISDYKNQEVLAQSDAAVAAFKKSLDDLFVKAATGDLDINELDNVLNKFALAMSNVQDATKQIELYEARTGDEVSYKGKIASGHLDDKYSELTQFDDLQKLLYLLSQAKIDVNKTKDFYKDGFNTGKTQVTTDNNEISSNLQSIQSTLDSIYGVLQGFTGVEANGKNSLKYKEPAIDANVRAKELGEIDLPTLDSILQAVQEIGNYLSANKSNDVAGKIEQDNGDTSDLANFIKSKFSQQLALEDTLQAVKAVVDNLYTVLSKENNEVKIDDQNTEEPQNSDVYQLLLSKLPQNVASEDTLLAIKSTIEQIVEATKAKDNAAGNKDSDIQESLGTLVSALTANINALKDATNGIIDHQKAQKSDTTKAMAKIADPAQYKQMSDIAANSVGNLGSEVEIKGMRALADGIVKVEGAFKNASGAWEGFTVGINESNQAVDLAINKQSAYAKALNDTSHALKQQKIKDNAQLNTISKQGSELYKSLKINPLDTSDAATAVRDTYAQLTESLIQYKAKREALTDDELNGLKQIYDQLMANAQAYAKINGQNQQKSQKNYGSNIMMNRTAQYNALQNKVQGNSLLQNSSVLKDAINEYEASWNKLQSLYNTLQNTPNPTEDDKIAFKEASAECNNLGKEVEKLLKSYDKMRNDSNVVNQITLGNYDDRAKELRDYVEATYGAKAAIGDFKNNYNELEFTIDNGNGTFTKAKVAVDNLRTSIIETAGDTQVATSRWGTFINELKNKARGITTYLISMTGFQEIWQQVRQGVQYVREIDSALTELKKVTDETDATYKKFLQTASKTAAVIGSNVADFTNATADFARLGYNLEEAANLAKAASVYKNVGDGIENISQASESIISTMKAFGVEADNAMGIVDRFNAVGNSFAISSTGIGEAMQRSASALFEAGNTIDESIALITGANSVVQNPEQVGTALKTLALRLRGTKTELEEAGEDTDGMAESVSQLQAKLKALTHGKVDIMIDANTFKSTTEILREMSQAWQDMTDIERASALELMGGKRQANILSSIIKNFQTVEDVIQTSANASGSALAENEKYLNSIQGKIDKFNNALQTFWMNFVDSSVIKGIVDLGTTLVQLLDTVHGKILAVVAAIMVYKKFKDGVKFADMFKGAADVIKGVYTAIQSMIAANSQLTVSQKLVTISTMGLKTALQGLWTVLKANPLYAIAAVVAAAALAFDYFHTTAQEAADAAKEAFDEIQNIVNSTKSTIQSLESELSTLQDKINELDGKQLSFAEDQELEKLKKQREELEHSLKVQEQLLELQRESSNKQAVASMKAYTKAASEGAEETQKTAKTWGTIGGVAAGIAAAAGILLAIPTGGLSLGATATGVAALGVAGGVAGNKIGEAVGSGIAENEGTYDSWYETYTKALETARKEEQKELEKYKKDSSNIDKLDKWQEAQQKVSDIETEMYEHLSQMQQYFNGLEYGPDEEINKELDAWYNFLDKFSIDQRASGAEVTALERIFGENASEEIQSIKEQISEAVNAGKDFDFTAAINGSQKLKNTLDYVGLSAEDVKNYFTQIGEAASNTVKDVTPVAMYSDLLEDAEAYKEILLQTSEVVVNNTKVTQEYKDSLIELIGSESEVNKYFDENNKLIVKDAKGLNNLVKSAKKNAAANTSLAKSQARLQYYQLFKKMQSYVNAEGRVIAAHKNEVLALYREMNALEKTIAYYSRLEAQLLDTGNAYDQFEKAQEIDNATDYIGSVETWIAALGEAFNTAELGTESAQVAIAGLVPESVYKDLDTVDAKMSAIYSYFKTGKLAQYFDIQFDEDGAIQSAEMKLGNLRKFIEDGLANNTFVGSDWMHFDLSESIDSLEEFAKAMGVTEEVAFAFIESMEDHDIEWLNGDYSSMFEDILPDNLANDIYENTSALADLAAQLADGKITAEEYTAKWSELNKVSQENAQKARESASAWIETTNDIEDAKIKVQELSSELEALKQQGASESEIKLKTAELNAAEQDLTNLAAKLSELEAMDPVVLQVALDQAQAEIDAFEQENSTLLAKVEIVQDAESGEHTYEVKAGITLDENEKKKLEGYLEDVNAKYSFENALGGDIATTEDHLQSIENILQSIHDVISGKTSNSADSSSVGDIGDFDTGKLTDIKEFFAAIPEKWDELWSDIGTFLDGLGEEANALKERLGKFFTETVPEKWDEFWNDVGEFFAPLVEEANALKEKVTLFFTDTIPEKWDEFLAKSAEVWNGVQEWADATKEKVVNFFTVTIPEKWGQFWDKAGEVWNNVQEWADATKDTVINFFSEVMPEKWNQFWDKVDEFFTENLPYAIGYIAGSVTRFFVETVPEKWDEFLDTIGEAWEDTKEWAEMTKDKIIDFFANTIPEKWDEFCDSIDKFIDESIKPALSAIGDTVKRFFRETIPEKWQEFCAEVGKAWDNITEWANSTNEIIVTFFTQTIPDAWSKFWGAVGAFIDENVIPALSAIADAIKTFFVNTIPTKWNEFWANVGNFINEHIIPSLQAVKEKISEFFLVTIPQKWSELWNNVGTFLTTTVPQVINDLKTGITTFFTVTVPSAINSLWNGLTSWISTKASEFWSNLTSGWNAGRSGSGSVNGTAHAAGTAHKSGNWGLPKSERNSLVGELGPEMVVDPSSGRYYTVGDAGAEMVDLPKGAIIFNHQQTKSLLKNGYVTSRGKAYAEGNAHVTMWPIGSSKDQWDGTGYDSWDDPTWDESDALSNAADKISDAADSISDDAEQVVDFIEMKLEEIEATIEKTSSRIANFLDDTTDIKSKDELYDELVKAEKDKSEAYLKAAQKYNVEAAAALSGVPKQYQEMARNGAIEIKDFIGEDQVEIAEKIQEYRDWAAKADEAENGHLEAIAAISAHRVEQLEDIATDFENIVSIAKSHTDLLQAEMDFIEESGGRLSESYYEELKKYSQKQLDDMQAERKALQKILDDAVAAGDVVIGSDDWYSMLQTIYDVDKEIIDCKTSLEEFQNAINELYWDNFEKFIDQIENVNSELSNLYDLISDDDDVVDEMGNWTDKGITALGLLAQQMENAQFKSQQYGEAIEKLKKDYANGLYSADEYTEKLAELTDEQYSAIKSYEDAKDAIVNLNKTRAEAVKKYMQDEIDAYSELIEKKKEALNEDKSAYDFQKQVQESDKNIKDIERKIAALAGNTSSSAMAQRKRLEAELLKAQKEQQDMYYNHSIEKQQEALDKELEDYTQNKQDQMDALDEYLKKEEQVIADSFDLVAENTKVITNTLIKISEEYGVTISDTVATPWLKGANAIGTYEEQLNTSVSATTKNLEALKKQLEDLQKQADKTAESIVKATHSTVVKTNDGQQTSIKGYAKGSKGVEKDQWALIEELGDELQLVPNSAGRLDYIKKGTGILNNTLTERLMNLAMDPSSMIESNRPVIGTPGITTNNNTFTIDASVGTLLHVEHLDGSNPAEVAKLVNQAWEKKMQTLNNSIKKFTR